MTKFPTARDYDIGRREKLIELKRDVNYHQRQVDSDPLDGVAKNQLYHAQTKLNNYLSGKANPPSATSGAAALVLMLAPKDLIY